MPHRPSETTWYRFVRWNLRHLIFPLLGGFRTIGWENVPTTGPVLLAPNHVSNFDPPAIAAGLPRGIKIIAKEELFRNPLLARLHRSLGAFPVRRGEGDAEAVRHTLRLLEAGWAMIVFPEGTRTDGRKLLPFNRGVAMLAKRSGAAVVPMAMVGTHILFPKGAKRLRRACTTTVFGEPFTYESVAMGENEKENRELFSRELERRILALAASQGMKIEPSG